MMNQTEITFLQKKIADYPERIAKLQKRQEMIAIPAATEIDAAIKGLNAYIIQLTATKSAFDKIEAEAGEDTDKLMRLSEEYSSQNGDVPETCRLSLVQIQHILMTVKTHTASLGELIDNAASAREKLELARKHKKTLDVVNLLRMIEKGDGYRL
ncbi:MULTISPECIES: hypothetical protein [unclassified Butyrivibrio]|uniref:hypothetical protein n=1 Tax=unclassified Butyrivibrio TaxID=2639466 RepID=UPI0003B5D2E7|nr:MULTISPECIES: hypothetical protein [unclassified Butyrivibrio]MDC7294283.1 hypothetical protein [Butyrivibrio sp. DSM 10294]